ncbi:hydroxyisourate hydrolase [Pseudocnuella soli]|uniref:hydroxyisourate hydrolase n=1 Tax=Pseudocnuella soli TaxID=2502779 RepID=UPI0010486F20|nr:hydroxyisourate hydrolase [Pseudocnuella soli]
MKQLFLAVLFFVGAYTAQAQEFQLSTHILDVSLGQPASGVTIRLDKWDAAGNLWNKIAEKQTDANGRIKDLLPGTGNTGVYKLTFYTQPYFQLRKMNSFYPFIEVAFEIKDKEHYHVPITLSAYGYSTYRGN